MSQAEPLSTIIGVLDGRLASLERLLSSQLSVQQQQTQIQEALLRAQTTKSDHDIINLSCEPLNCQTRFETGSAKTGMQTPGMQIVVKEIDLLERRCEETVDELFSSLNLGQNDRGNSRQTSPCSEYVLQTPPYSKMDVGQDRHVSLNTESDDDDNLYFYDPVDDEEQSKQVPAMLDDGGVANAVGRLDGDAANAVGESPRLTNSQSQESIGTKATILTAKDTMESEQSELPLSNRRKSRKPTGKELRSWTNPSLDSVVAKMEKARDPSVANKVEHHRSGATEASFMKRDSKESEGIEMNRLSSTESEKIGDTEDIFDRLLKGTALAQSKFEGNRPFVVFTESRYGGKQISEYDAGRFANITSLRYLFHRGSALRSKQIALNFFFHMIIAAATAIVVEITQLDAEYMADRGASLTGEVSGWVVFLLGPYFGILFGRWWTLRTECLGGFWGNCDDICMLFAARFKASKRLGTIIQRWMTAAWTIVELNFTRASQDEVLALMVEEGLLSDSEAVLLLDARSPPQNILGWILDVLYELVRSGQLQGEMRTFEEKIVGARGAIGFLFAHFDTQVSFSFVHLMSFLMHLSNILSATVVGLSLAIAWEKKSEQGTIQLISYFVQHLVRCIFLQGMLVNIAHMNDPFGPHTGGMPLAQFFNVFNEETTSFISDEKPTRKLFGQRKAGRYDPSGFYAAPTTQSEASQVTQFTQCLTASTELGNHTVDGPPSTLGWVRSDKEKRENTQESSIEDFQI